MVELLAGPLIGDLTSAESIALDDGRGGSPMGGELVLAIDPAAFLGAAMSVHLARAEAMFAAIEAQGARLPSSRRYAARRESLAKGVTIPARLYDDIMRIRECFEILAVGDPDGDDAGGDTGRKSGGER